MAQAAVAAMLIVLAGINVVAWEQVGRSGQPPRGAESAAMPAAAMVAPGVEATGVEATGVVATASVDVPSTVAPDAAPRLAWQRQYPGVTFRESSPVAANLGVPAVVVGGLDGKVYGLDLTTGATLPGWPVATGKPIDSSPSAADLYGTGRDEIVIGTGIADGSKCGGGAVYAIDPSGTVRWVRAGVDGVCATESFHAAPAIGDITGRGVPDVTVGALGLESWSFDASGNLNPGWPYYTDDTVFATPALASLTGDGTTEVVMGGDSSPGGTIDHRGGVVRAVTGDGHTLWQFFTDEIVRSSPAVGDLAGNGHLSVVFGTGDYWISQPGGAQDSHKVYALGAGGNLEWVRNLGGETLGAPALADVSGNGTLDVVIGTADGPQGGLVRVLGPDGKPLPQWGGIRSGGGVVIGGISTADLNGDGAQDLLVPTGSGVFAYDGRTATRLFALDARKLGFQSTPLVTTDPDGSIGITVAGTTAYGEGVIQHWVMPSSRAKIGARAWPTFHHDARRTGNAGATPITNPTCAGAGVNGYWEAAADGGVFGWCGAQYRGASARRPGPTGMSPIVGLASTPSGHGYWQVAADGGVFAFGDARFYGSAAGLTHSPIIGIAHTPDGAGYWLAAADGSVFAFGDAHFFGGAGGVHLPFKVVSITATPHGDGYWLFGNQGTVLTYGGAGFFGSPVGMALASPIVAAAATPSGLGYWMVSKDGGVFTYGLAGYFGSTGSVHLNQSIVGIAPTAAGRGYWLVAADGGIFSFGDARYVGSVAGRRLNGPVVGLAVPAGA